MLVIKRCNTDIYKKIMRFNFPPMINMPICYQPTQPTFQPPHATFHPYTTLIHNQPLPGRQLRWLQYEACVLTLQLQGNPIQHRPCSYTCLLHIPVCFCSLRGQRHPCGFVTEQQPIEANVRYKTMQYRQTLTMI